MIELRHVEKKFEDTTPLKDVNAIINDGDVISIIGPSGTGKSTLLRCINMLGAPTNGEIIVDGECINAPGYDVSKARKKIGMVFQSFNLFPHLTIIENIMKPQIELLGKSKQEAYEKAIELLKKVGLASKIYQYPDMLSGGQKQRVAICRTLAMEPNIILFDEPTSALDPTMVGEVQAVIKDLANQGNTMMIVTHEMQFARSICNKVFFMCDGGVYEVGTPEEIFEHPKRNKTRVFVKQLKVLELRINSKDFDFQSMSSKIDEYGYKNQIDPKLTLKISSAFEELCRQIIVPALNDDLKLVSFIEYNNKTSVVTMEVKYGGGVFNPKDTDNKIALKIFKNSIKSYRYSKIENDEKYENRVLIKF